jgi:hypothetical protein
MLNREWAQGVDERKQAEEFNEEKYVIRTVVSDDAGSSRGGGEQGQEAAPEIGPEKVEFVAQIFKQVVSPVWL